MKFLYAYAEKMSINMRLKESKILQETIDKWKAAEASDDEDEGKSLEITLKIINILQKIINLKYDKFKRFCRNR